MGIDSGFLGPVTWSSTHSLLMAVPVDRGVMTGERLLSVLGREHAVAILRGTADPVGARELADRCDIPVAACHRRLEELEQCGLLREFETVTEQGRSQKRYVRVVEDLHVRIERSAVDVTVGCRPTPTTTLDLAWQRLEA